MIKPLHEPGIAAGAAVGVLLTTALISILYAGWRLFSLPFVPFDIFDWMSRVLPGSIISFGIGTMVAIIRAVHVGPTASTAKVVEQATGIVILLIAGAVIGVLFFAIMRAVHRRYACVVGTGLGLLVGIAGMLVSSRIGHVSSGSSLAKAIWILFLFLCWGAAFAWVYQRLLTVSKVAAISEQRREELAQFAPGHVERINRRNFLIRLAGAAATITVSGAVIGAVSGRHQNTSSSELSERWSTHNPLPNEEASVTPAPGTRPEYTSLEKHYRIDINTIAPSVDEHTWKLHVQGLVEQPLALSLEDIRSYIPIHQFITLACISNPVAGDLIGTTRWTGVSLKRLISDFKLKKNATHIKIQSADGFYEIVPIETIMSDDRIMLAYAWDGVPLLREHGFPLRIYIPDLYGMKQPKWIDSIEVTDHWEPGYWVVRGWDEVARMKATSVIDTIHVNANDAHSDQRQRVVIGGIAHAGARGISKVELQVDDGPWQQAAVRTPLSDLTWIIWRYEWPFEAGNHTFTVRCSDGNSQLQISLPSPPEPSGATGLHRKTKSL